MAELFIKFYNDDGTPVMGGNVTILSSESRQIVVDDVQFDGDNFNVELPDGEYFICANPPHGPKTYYSGAITWKRFQNMNTDFHEPAPVKVNSVEKPAPVKFYFISEYIENTVPNMSISIVVSDSRTGGPIRDVDVMLIRWKPKPRICLNRSDNVFSLNIHLDDDEGVMPVIDIPGLEIFNTPVIRLTDGPAVNLTATIQSDGIYINPKSEGGGIWKFIRRFFRLIFRKPDPRYN